MKKKSLLVAAAIVCVVICVAFVSGRPELNFNGKKMSVSAAPLEDEGTLLIPAEYLEKMGVTAAVDLEAETASFIRGETTLSLEAGDKDIIFNELEEEIAYAPMIKDGVFYLPADLLLLLGYDYETENSRSFTVQERLFLPIEELGELSQGESMRLDFYAGTFESLSRNIAEAMIAGDFQVAYDNGTPEYKEENPPESIKGDFEFATELRGAYVGFYDYEENYQIDRSGKVVCESRIRFDYTEGSLLLRFYYEHGGLMNRHVMIPGDFLLPRGLTEEEVTVGEGTAHPLGGTLTLPEGDGPFKVALLLPGSGVVDRDQNMYYTMKPFEDLAWGLAENGVASLRFDKRIYAYKEEYEMNPELTVNDELIEDALLATELLRADGRFDGFYIAGHSLGGMFAPIVHAKGGNFDGIITLAGTARNLWELGKTQKLYYAEHGYAAEPEKAAQYMADYEAVLSLGNIRLIDDALAKTITLGDKYLYYYKDSLNYDLETAVKQAHIPYLVLQGTADFQIYEGIDYALYKEILADNPEARFKLYNNLNHFFMVSPETGKGTPDEYYVDRTRMPDYVAEDVAGFILGD